MHHLLVEHVLQIIRSLISKLLFLSNSVEERAKMSQSDAAAGARLTRVQVLMQSYGELFAYSLYISETFGITDVI